MFQPVMPARSARLTAGAMAVAALMMIATTVRAQPSSPASSWKPVEAHLLSRFAKDVSPVRALPDYPRPQLVRSEWLNLNGLWQYAIQPKDAARPGASFDGEILVPFAPESALSGVGKAVGPDQRLWYRRAFRVPASWAGKRICLRFDAVDWDTTVSVNGKADGFPHGRLRSVRVRHHRCPGEGRRPGARGVGVGPV